MRRWIVPTLVSCAAASAAAQLLSPLALPAHTGRIVAVVLLGAALVATWGAWLHDGVQAVATDRPEPDHELRYRALFEACGDAICTYELPDDGGAGRLVEVNETACMALGYPRRELLAMTWPDLYAPEVRHAVQQRMRALRGAGSLVFESTYLTSDGDRLPVQVSLRRVDEAGRRLCLAVARDVTADRELAQSTHGHPESDELTGLLSRRGFFASVGEARSGRAGLGAQVLVVHVELAGLKAVNDRCGHAAGDALVLAVADVLRLAFREGRRARPTGQRRVRRPGRARAQRPRARRLAGRSWHVSTKPRPSSAPSWPGSSPSRCGLRQPRGRMGRARSHRRSARSHPGARTGRSGFVDRRPPSREGSPSRGETLALARREPLGEITTSRARPNLRPTSRKMPIRAKPSRSASASPAAFSAQIWAITACRSRTGAAFEGGAGQRQTDAGALYLGGDVDRGFWPYVA